MKKKEILLAVAILLSTVCFAQAEEATSGKLSGTLDVTYVSKFMWRGFDWFSDDDGAIIPSLDIDLFGTGFGTKIMWVAPIQSGHENWEWLNYELYYKNTLFEEETYATDYKLAWAYYHFPDEPQDAKNLQDITASLSWPNICPFGVVPSYTVARVWPSESGATIGNNWGGWMHFFGLDYNWILPNIIPQIPEQTIRLSADLVYNEGVLTGDHEWSHMLFGIGTDFELGHNLTLTPALYYQASMDDSLNRDDECWIGLGVKYKF